MSTTAQLLVSFILTGRKDKCEEWGCGTGHSGGRVIIPRTAPSHGNANIVTDFDTFACMLCGPCYATDMVVRLSVLTIEALGREMEASKEEVRNQAFCVYTPISSTVLYRHACIRCS